MAEQRFYIGNREIAYEVFGSTFDPAIILIRGLGTQMIEWPRNLIDCLSAAGYCAVVFDNRDSGHSSRSPESYSLTDMAIDTKRLMDHLSIKEANIVGMSMGGIIAQLLALKFPERVKSLTLMMTTSGKPSLPLPDEHILTLWSSQANDKHSILTLGVGKRQYLLGRAEKEDESQSVEYILRCYERDYDLEATQIQMKAVMSEPSREKSLPNIDIPVLIIHGTDDLMVPIAHASDLHELIPNSKLVVLDGMGHATTITFGKAIAQHIVKFLEPYTVKEAH